MIIMRKSAKGHRPEGDLEDVVIVDARIDIRTELAVAPNTQSSNNPLIAAAVRQTDWACDRDA